MEIFIFLVLVVCAMYFYFNTKKVEEQKEAENEYIKKMESIIEGINNGTVTYTKIDSDIPIRLKQGEYTVAMYKNVRCGTYKNTGKVNYVGGSGRIRIAKGVSINTGRRKAVSEKGWVFDQEGTIYITNKRIIFNGDHTNTNLPYDKMLSAVCTDGEYLMVDRETGKDVCFYFSDFFPPEHSVFVYVNGRGDTIEVKD